MATIGKFYEGEGELYEVLQGHILADHWPPPEVASLHSKV